MIIFLQCMAKKLKSHSSTELGVVIEKKIHYISYHQACVFTMKTTNFLYFTHSRLRLTLRVSKRIYLVLQMFKQWRCKIERCRIIQLESVANRNGRIKYQFRQTHSIENHWKWKQPNADNAICCHLCTTVHYFGADNNNDPRNCQRCRASFAWRWKLSTLMNARSIQIKSIQNIIILRAFFMNASTVY